MDDGQTSTSSTTSAGSDISHRLPHPTSKGSSKATDASHLGTGRGSSVESTDGQCCLKDSECSSHQPLSAAGTKGTDSQCYKRRSQPGKGKKTSADCKRSSAGDVSSTSSCFARDHPNCDKDSSAGGHQEPPSTDSVCTSSAKEHSNCSNNKNGDLVRRSWSLSEDSMLLGIKAANDGMSWAEIGKILSIPKDEAKIRWKEIKDQPADLTRRKYKTPGISNENTCESGQVSKKDADKIGDDTELPADREDQSVSNSSSSALSCCDSLWQEKHLQRRYWLKNISSNIYAPYIELEADACFSQRDCEILKTLDSKYRTNRWLEMQANFYNATGRMIPLEMIRTKLERAEHLRAHLTKEQAADAESACARRKRSIEEWIADIILEAPTDPEAS